MAWSPGWAAVELETKVLNDGGFIAFGYNDSVKQGNGYIHIAVQGTPSDDPTDESSRDIYYMLVKSDGSVLIDATKVSGTTSRWGRPHIALTTTGKAVITWNGNSDGRIHYVFVDPKQDARNGGAADPNAILEVADTIVGVNTSNGHNSLVVDKANVAHVFKTTGPDLIYFSFNPATGAIGTAEVNYSTVLGAQVGSGTHASDPVADLDSDGNLHVLFQGSDTDSLGPVKYMMVDGSDGSVLIEPTALYGDAGMLQHASHYSIAVDGKKRVHAVYGDKRFTIDRDSWCDTCEIGGHMFYTRLDPSKDPQDGTTTASDLATMRIGNEAMIWGVWYSKAFLNGSGDLDVIGTTGGDDSNSRQMAYVRVAPTSAGASIGTPKVYTASSLTPGWSKHFVSVAGSSVIWASGGFSIPYAQPTYPLVMAPMSRFSGGGGGGGGGGLSPFALLVLLASALARVLARAPRVLAAALGLVALLGAANVAAQQELEPLVLNDGATVAFGRPDVAVGSSGNIHIVATGTDAASPSPGSQDSGRDIYYMLVKPDGTVLIDATKVTLTSGQYSGPQVAVTSTGKASITYKRNGSALMTVLVDPSLDDQSGDAANPATVVTLAETTVGVSTSTGHHATVMGKDGATVHVLWPDSTNLHYLSFTAATGAVVTAEKNVAQTGGRGITPGLGIDSDGNLHVLYQANEDNFDFDPLAYTMLDGTGNVLIGRSLLLDDAGIPQHGSNLSLVVDSKDKVHLVYGDKRFVVDRNDYCFQCEIGGDMFYTRINPARHPQNGGFGSIAQMREGDETHLGGFWYSKAFRGSNGKFNLYSTTGGDDSNNSNMVYLSFSPTDSGASVGKPRLATVNVMSPHWSKHYVDSVADRVVWVAGGWSVPLNHQVFPLVMARVSDFSALKVGKTTSSSGSGVLPLGTLLVLGFAGLAGALRRRLH